MNNFLLDLPNLLTCILFIFVVYRLKIIPPWIALVFVVQSFLPLLLNNVLFPASYMPDQFKYFGVVNSIRNFDFAYDIPSATVHYASVMLSFIPIPFVETIKSLGFFNRLLFMILLIWIYKKNFLRGLPLYFILFFPSLALYTSLSLRDTLIMFFMIVATVLFLEKKNILSFLFAVPLFFIKFQNFFLMVIFYIIFYINNPSRKIYRFRFMMYIIVLVAFLPFLDVTIELLNFYRRAMYGEDGGDMDNFIPINDIYDFIILSLTAGPYFLMKPFIWEATSALQLIQAVENFFIIGILVLLTYRAFKYDKNITLKWLLYLFIASSIYGLVVFNFGTAVRYRFPFIVMYVVGLYYELFLENKYRGRLT